MTRYWTDDDSRALDALADEEDKRRRDGIPPDCPDCFGASANCPTCCEYDESEDE